MSRRTRGFRFSPSPECDAVEPLMVRAAVESLSEEEETALALHLRLCQRCRAEAMEVGDYVASLRQLDRSVGSPSKRFAERLRARLTVERALSGAPRGPEPQALPSRAVPRTAPAPRAQPAASARKSSARRFRLALAALLAISVGFNLWWLSRSFGPRDGASPVAKALPVAASSAEPLVGRLARLRAALDDRGLVAGDAAATAWWLIAEARARAAAASLGPPDGRSIERAQAALLLEALPTSRLRALAALGLVESEARLAPEPASGVAARALRLLGMNDAIAPASDAGAALESVRRAAAAQLSALEFAPSRALDGASRRAERQVGARFAEGASGDRFSWGSLAQGDGPAAVTAALAHLGAGAWPGEPEAQPLDAIRPASSCAEAVCAAAAASMIPAPR